MPRFTSHKRILPNKQQGAALLLFVLLLVVGASSLLVSKLNKAATQSYRDDVTMKALIKAKEALIGYAVSYPDVISGGTNLGPGHLPCPDTGNNGVLQPSCSISGGTSLRRLPWQSLALGDIRDFSGERLWYVVSDTFRSGPSPVSPMNSETLPLGDLTLNSQADVVALIIAPGDALTGQGRNTPQEREESVNYIESDSGGNSNFTSSAPNSNDIILPLTRGELMRAVEKRVLGQTKQAFINYQTSYLSYPWLSSFFDPRSTNTSLPIPFIESVGVNEGHLGIHITDRWFPTTFQVDWDVNNTTLTPILNSNTIVTDSLLNGEGVGSITVAQPSINYGPSVTGGSECQWTNQTTVRCRGSATLGVRIYDFDISFESETTTINNPSDTSSRTRTVTTSSPFQTGTNIQVRISDTSTGTIETGTSTILEGSAGTITVSNINYFLDADTPLDLPRWFIQNNWHHFILLAESAGLAPGAAGACGGSNPPCLTVHGNTPAIGLEPEVIAVIAGGILSSQDRTTSLPAAPLDISQYFELENSTGSDGTFTRTDHLSIPYSNFPLDFTVLNDQLTVISP